jgi:hypothetical protein
MDPERWSQPMPEVLSPKARMHSYVASAERHSKVTSQMVRTIARNSRKLLIPEAP